jgi:hypothetical protein
MKTNNLEQYLEINGCQYLKNWNYMILSSIYGHIWITWFLKIYFESIDEIMNELYNISMCNNHIIHSSENISQFLILAYHTQVYVGPSLLTCLDL